MRSVCRAEHAPDMDAHDNPEHAHRPHHPHLQQATACNADMELHQRVALAMSDGEDTTIMHRAPALLSDTDTITSDCPPNQQLYMPTAGDYKGDGNEISQAHRPASRGGAEVPNLEKDALRNKTDCVHTNVNVHVEKDIPQQRTPRSLAVRVHSGVRCEQDHNEDNDEQFVTVRSESPLAVSSN